MDKGGYKSRTFNENEKNVGGTHGLYFIFFLLEHVTSVVPILCFFPAAGLTYASGGGAAAFISWLIAVPLVAILTFALTLVALSNAEFPDQPCDWTRYIDVTETKMREQYRGKKIPIERFVEAYMNQRAEFVKDPLEVFWHRHEIFRFNLTPGHLKFFLFKFTGQLVFHSQQADSAEVRDVYDRGNDYYRGFLGPLMNYTSGVFESQEESLETAQERKMDLVARKTRMKPGDEHLDIGCGWGTLLAYCAKNYGTKSTGVTLAREQCDWGMKQAKDMGVEDRVKMLCMDYRSIPMKQYDVITSLEMIEHVGIKNVQSFLLQIKSMLKPEGLFYLQLAGLRRAWQFEDLVWGL